MLSSLGATVSKLFCWLLVMPESETASEVTSVPELSDHANVTASPGPSTRHVSLVSVPDNTSRCPGVISGEGEIQVVSL